MSGGTEYPKEILSGGTHLGGARFTTTPFNTDGRTDNSNLIYMTRSELASLALSLYVRGGV